MQCIRASRALRCFLMCRCKSLPCPPLRKGVIPLSLYLVKCERIIRHPIFQKYWMFFFVKNNKQITITLFGQSKVHAYKNNNICYRFFIKEPYFKIESNRETLKVGNFLCIQSNLPCSFLTI